MASRCLQTIGVLHWGVELGRVDVLLETSLLAQHSANPRVGHLETAYHVFGHWMTHPRSRLVFDPAEPVIDELCFSLHDVLIPRRSAIFRQ
jgi:hypothetical protein